MKGTIIKHTALRTTFTEKAKIIEKKIAKEDNQIIAFPIEIFLIPEYNEIIYSSILNTTSTGSTTFNTIAISQISHRTTLNVCPAHDLSYLLSTGNKAVLFVLLKHSPLIYSMNPITIVYPSISFS